MILLIATLSRAANFGLLSIYARYLSDRGLSTDTIGFVLAVSGVVATPFLTIWSRVLARLGTAATGTISSALAAAGTTLLAATTAPVVLAIADGIISIGFVGLSTTVRTITGTGVHDQKESESRFGKLTGWQNAGGFIGPLLLGVLVAGGTWVAPWFTVGLFGLTTVLWLWLTMRTSLPRASETAERDSEDDGAEANELTAVALLWRLRAVILCTLGTSVLYGANSVVWGLYLKDLGASGMLTSWSFAIFSIPMVFLASHAGRIWRSTPRGLAIPLGTLSLGGMALVYAYTTSAAAAVALTILEGSLMALTMPIIAAQVPLVLSKTDIGRGFAYYGALNTVVSVIGSVLGGLVMAEVGVRSTWLIFGGFCMACAVASAVLTSGQGGRSRVEQTEEPAPAEVTA
ncbi:MFS transporter [Actinospica robiniae]|uniref:MFS transporter n=1 Tax=Actinospica robiniae TaxID=304901 RepID=UPI0003FAA37E|nr:MFS transporter [Actinospica robiniae]